MYELKIFKSEQFGAIRTMVNNNATEENQKVLFCAKDVAMALGYSDPGRAIRAHCKGAVDLTAPSNGGPQKMKYITEADIYRLVMSSKIPYAVRFQDWVCEEVLPQIRKTGGYIPVREEDDDMTILSKAVLILQRTLEKKEAIIEAQRHKVQFADAVASSDDSILIRDLAKLLTKNGFEIGQNRMFEWLRCHGFLFRRENRPIQKWVEQGIFEISETVISTHHGNKLCITTKVTGRGQQFFIDGFMSGEFKLVG